MKEFKGTKGEWKINQNRNIVDSKDYGIAQPHGINNDDYWNANAKLIASAPDLLKALQELVNLHQCEQEGLSLGQPTPKQWYETVLKAEEAINKAL